MAALFSLAIPSSGRGFPIRIVHSEDDARRDAVTSMPPSLLSAKALRLIAAMLGTFVEESGVRLPTAVISTALVVLFRDRLTPARALAVVPTTLAAVSAVLVGRRWLQIRSWTRNGTTNEFKTFPDVREEPPYQAPALLEQMMVQIPAKYFQHICYQPISGYCGYATINSVLASISFMATGTVNTGDPFHVGILAYPPVPGYVSVPTMLDLLRRVQREVPMALIANVEDLTKLDKEAFLAEIRTGMSSPRFRHIVCFHRYPLFFGDPSATDAERAAGRMKVHWSPVLSYLQGEDLVGIADVNQDFGTYLVPPERLWDACGDEIVELGGPGGGRMGLIRITVGK
ncbi:hypothetical protein DFJ74DRAFT_682282 [Hyaloraphidium curvatum]|nr:hypothetical protein DFJ74DRAFT_682282 [Hyaloraphidium curvatum]